MQHILRLLPLACLCLTMSACTQLGKSQIKDTAYFDNQKIEDSYQMVSSLQAKGANGETIVVQKDTLRSLRDIRSRLEKTSGQTFEYAVVDSDNHDHLLMDHDGKEYITFGVSFLNKHGNDQDVLAGVVAHDLAHIADHDTESAMDQRETNYFISRQIISTAVSFVGTPVAGYATSTALTGAEQAAIANEEDKVNPIGLKWLIDAGYTPCGYVKLNQENDESSALGSPLQFLYFHPGKTSRGKLAQEYIDANPTIVCPTPVSKPSANNSAQ